MQRALQRPLRPTLERRIRAGGRRTAGSSAGRRFAATYAALPPIAGQRHQCTDGGEQKHGRDHAGVRRSRGWRRAECVAPHCEIVEAARRAATRAQLVRFAQSHVVGAALDCRLRIAGVPRVQTCARRQPAELSGTYGGPANTSLSAATANGGKAVRFVNAPSESCSRGGTGIDSDRIRVERHQWWWWRRR